MRIQLYFVEFFKLNNSCAFTSYHGYLPANMLSMQLPLITSKYGLISSNNNCIPTAIASVLSKVHEYIILERMELFVYTHENQFGLKKQHDTDN